MTVDEVATWLRAKGCATTIGSKKEYVACKKPDIVYAAFMNDCAEGRCRSLTFFFGIKVKGEVTSDTATANAIASDWNAHFRWARASFESTRYVHIVSDEWAAAPATTETLDNSLTIFLAGINEFCAYLKKKGLTD